MKTCRNPGQVLTQGSSHTLFPLLGVLFPPHHSTPNFTLRVSASLTSQESQVPNLLSGYLPSLLHGCMPVCFGDGSMPACPNEHEEDVERHNHQVKVVVQKKVFE